MPIPIPNDLVFDILALLSFNPFKLNYYRFYFVTN